MIRERTPARLSVFWNSARISLLTSSGVNSLAKGPFPDAQRSSISRKLALSTTIISVKRFHFHTYLTISPLEVWKNIFKKRYPLVCSELNFIQETFGMLSVGKGFHISTIFSVNFKSFDT